MALWLHSAHAAGNTVDLPLPPAGGPVRVEESGQDVVLRYPGPLGRFDAPALLARADGGLEAVDAGYDSILLRAAPGVAIRVKAGDAGPRLVLHPHAAPPDPAAADAEELRLGLLEAQVLVLGGSRRAARERLETLRREHPDNAEAAGALAGVETGAGRWLKGLALYQEAARLDPDNAVWPAQAAHLAHEHASRIVQDVDWRRVEGGETLVAARTMGDLRLGLHTRLGAAVEVARLSAPAVRSPDGTVAGFRGLRQRGQVEIRHETEEGAAYVGRLFFGARGPGFGAGWEWPDDGGRTLAAAEWNRPNWLYVEGVAFDGARDRLSVARTQTLDAAWSGRIEIGLNRYRIAGTPVARTVAIDGQIRAVPFPSLPFLSAAYALNAEYAQSVRTRAGPDGAPFQPLAVSDREVHAGTVNLDAVLAGEPAEGGAAGGAWTAPAWTAPTWIAPTWTAHVYGGYGIDRFGRAGPLAGFVSTVRSGAWDFQLRGSYVDRIGRTGETSAVLGGHAIVRF